MDFSSGKIDLATPKIIFLDTYLILYSELAYAHSVQGNNQHSKMTGSLASNVIKLYSSYAGCYLVSGSIRLGWIQIVLIFIRDVVVGFFDDMIR